MNIQFVFNYCKQLILGNPLLNITWMMSRVKKHLLIFIVSYCCRKKRINTVNSHPIATAFINLHFFYWKTFNSYTFWEAINKATSLLKIKDALMQLVIKLLFKNVDNWKIFLVIYLMGLLLLNVRFLKLLINGRKVTLRLMNSVK